MKLSRNRLIKIACAALLIAGLWWGAAAFAQTPDTGLNFAADTGLGNTDPRETVARVIRIGLGFLGVVAVGLIMYAGFLWMNAKGNEERIEQAKKILISAAIGLAIILAAFGIVSFILSRLMDATNGNQNGGGCQGPDCGGFEPGESTFHLTAVAPADGSTGVPRNSVIRLQFNERIKASSASGKYVQVYGSSDSEVPGGAEVAEGIVSINAGTQIEGNLSIHGDYIDFTPAALCEEPNQDQHCFDRNSKIRVVVSNAGFTSESGRSLTCDKLCDTTFETGEIIDTDAPQVSITTRQICSSTVNNITASATDNYAVSKIDFFANDQEIGSSLNRFFSNAYVARISWNAAGIAVGQNIKLKATGYDLDSNFASAEKTIRVSAPHCCNGLKDGDETGIDCGGSCLACNGESCRQDAATCSDTMCSSGFCGTGGCLCEARPMIEAVTPAGGFCSNDANKFCHIATQAADCGSGAFCNAGTPNGATGNFVTIIGENFGTARGKVYFKSSGNRRLQAELADSPAGNPACVASVWTDTHITVLVPANAVDGPLEVEAANGSVDLTNDGYGNLITDFKSNTIQRPGICGLTPSAGKLNDVVEYQGVKLNNGEAYYGNLSSNLKAAVSVFTSPREGTATVPNLVTGRTTTFVAAENVESNFLPFTKQNEPYSGPIISSIEPTSGPVGQYVTIRGSGFGGTRGQSKVYFGDTSGKEADYAFPDVCAQSVWTDKQIIIKVPKDTNTAAYKITVARDGYPAIDSGSQTFQVTTGTPNPGLCAIQPIISKANSAVTVWGEYFQNKDAASTIRFYNNNNQQGPAITFWDIDQTAGGIKPWKAVTTVPQSATTGPVKILVGASGQASNSVNFTVGSCSKDEDCGGAATCCAAGLPEAGKCKATGAECYGSVATSVYEWQFTTATTQNTCAPDQQQCGTACCAAGSCENASENKCAQCQAGQNQCGNGSCCNTSCVSPGPGQPSVCQDPPSCSGYNNNQCVEGYICPNSPGQCSLTPGSGNPVVTGDCGNAVCNSKPGCTDGSCVYNASLNRCVKNSANACSAKDLKDNQGRSVLLNDQPANGICRLYNNQPLWQIDWNASDCPSGWTRLPNNKCVDIGRVNGLCDVCSGSLKCTANGTRGVCAVEEAICGAGSTCNASTNKCEKPDSGTCACCCDKNQNLPQGGNLGCCAGLTCGGSCGAGAANLGLCSGCAPNGVPDDSLCNCVGTGGKFCSVTPQFPTGACMDCSAISDPGECSSHSECCVDGKNGNKCTSVRPNQPRVPEDDGKNTLQFCGYFACSNQQLGTCNPLAVKNGPYTTLDVCNQSCATAPIPCSGDKETCSNPQCPSGMRCDMGSCECKEDVTPPGSACRDPQTGNCNQAACGMGYQCLLPFGYGNGNPSGDITNDTCRCCCKPPSGPNEIDTCKLLDPGLSCVANQGLCTSPGNDRGACCGCTSDTQCGDTATTGCGLTDARCCQARPEVTARLPLPGGENICRNPQIEATFSNRMDLASFSDNVVVIGDYENDPCPAGYPVVAATQPSTRLAYMLGAVKKIVAKVLPFWATKEAFADVSNYCYVSGNVVGYDSGPTESKAVFRLTKTLDANRNYYVVLKGDPALAEITPETLKDHYNANITNLAKVGLNGASQRRLPGYVPAIFNHSEFLNAAVWTFKTGSEICAVNGVNVNPSFYLFQQTGQEKLLTATARSRSGQPIQPIAGFYDWTWQWNSENSDIAKVEQTAQPEVAKASAGNKQDAQTLGKATATVTVDNVFTPTTRGKGYAGTSQLRLFLCANPWPVYYAYPPVPAGYTWPWKDAATGIEFYYCRDNNGVGTSDDLPAIEEAPLTPPGTRKICMAGVNSGKVCTSDADCANVSGSCLPEVLKEFFFFQGTEPSAPTITGSAAAVGGSVTLRWSPAANAAKYKVYYGRGAGQYSETVDVAAAGAGREITKTIPNLVNGLTYYFSVTSLTAKNQESAHSNELKIKVADTTPPAVPLVRGSGGVDTANPDKGRIGLFWAPVPEAVSYIAYLGVQPRNGGEHEYTTNTTIRSIPAANTPNATFSGLNNGTQYYLSVRSVDQYGNVSEYAPEITVNPNRPYLTSAEVGSGGVTLKWLPFVGAQGYTITYAGRGSEGQTVTVNPSVFQYTIGNLTPGVRYTFTVTAKKTGTQNSDPSNQVTATP